MSRKESRLVMNEIMDKKATDAQISAFLVALRMKGETVDEITGTAEAMSGKMRPISFKYKNMVDTSGTGGDNLGTFNISTTSAFVTAGAGVTVAKHGHKSVSGKCGSADLLVRLGVDINISIKIIRQCLAEIGIAFFFSQKFNKSWHYAMGPRREIGSKTIFNILGPLTNPAHTRRQVIGVYDEKLMSTVIDVMRELDAEQVMTVHGNDGLDEITISGATKIIELIGKETFEYEICPEDFGLQRASVSEIQSESCEQNVRILNDVLSGKKGPHRDVVLLNAGAAIKVSGKTDSLHDGIQLARHSIDSGAALDKLNKVIALSQKLKG